MSKRTEGAAPGGHWLVTICQLPPHCTATGGPNSGVVRSALLAAGESFTATVPGSMEGSATQGEFPYGVPYQVIEQDPRGATVTVSQFPVLVTDASEADVGVLTDAPQSRRRPPPPLPRRPPLPLPRRRPPPRLPPTPTPTPPPTPTPTPPPDPVQPILPPGCPTRRPAGLDPCCPAASARTWRSRST